MMSVNKYRIKDICDIAGIVNTKCVIYGAGIYGNQVYSFLKLKRLERMIPSFVVSCKEGNPDSIDGLPVKTLEELREELPECNIVVAIGIAHIEEVFTLLKEYKVKGVYYVTKEFMQKVLDEIAEEMRKLPLQQNKIFISCYEGMGYRCNCKYIAETLIHEDYPVEIVWAVSAGNEEDIPKEIKTVILFTNEYYREFYTSKICITNCGTGFFGEKREGQYYINTWHGYGPFKKAQGAVYDDREKLDKIREMNEKVDLFITGSIFYSQIYRDSFFYKGEIYESGAPRNDVFFGENNIKNAVYKKFGISFDKKIVLYAPTFRTDTENSFDKYDLDISAILKALNTRFNSEYVLMYRFHHFLYSMKKCRDYYNNGIDATYYPDIQELLVAADIVITDYSSLMWDFSLQRKPVFLYQLDKEEYENDRGFYAPVSEWPYPQAHSQKELLEVIENFDHKCYIQKLESFLEKYGSCDDGHASERVVKWIMNKILSS
ncbi:MAG: hypothetical protein HFG70_01915 [Hungatella sp.]|nr:hypothetical protein [Hungatella sp.]